jgi:hypothetical protein
VCRDRLVVHLDEQAPNAAAEVGGRRGDGLDAPPASGGEQRPVQPERRADVIVEDQSEPLDANPGPAAAAANALAGAPDHLNRFSSPAGAANRVKLPAAPRRSSGTLPRPARPAALTLSLEISVPPGERTTQAAQVPALLISASWLTASPSPPTPHEASRR